MFLITLSLISLSVPVCKGKWRRTEADLYNEEKPGESKVSVLGFCGLVVKYQFRNGLGFQQSLKLQHGERPLGLVCKPTWMYSMCNQARFDLNSCFNLEYAITKETCLENESDLTKVISFIIVTS